MSGPLTMLDLVDEYLVARRSLGYALRIEGAQLRGFARFADETGHNGPLTLALILRWVEIPGRRARRFPGRRLDCIRPFAQARAAIDPANEVPPRGLVGPPRRRPVHHIYADAQIASLVAAARVLGPSRTLRGATYATLFGLLAATGLRVSEARHLTQADVDLDDAVLHIRATKFHKSRLVPLHPTATSALRSYALRRDRAAPPSPTAAFFVGARGMPLLQLDPCGVPEPASGAWLGAARPSAPDSRSSAHLRLPTTPRLVRRRRRRRAARRFAGDVPRPRARDGHLLVPHGFA